MTDVSVILRLPCLCPSEEHKHILVPTAHDHSGLRQESRALGATISGMRHRCSLRETGWAEFTYFVCHFKMGLLLRVEDTVR